MEKKYSIAEIKEMAAALGIAAKHDPASTTPSSPTLHGPLMGSSTQFGIFTYPGVRPQMFSTLVRPSSLARLVSPPEKSEYWQENLEIMTGVTEGDDSNADDFCGDPPATGQGKVCKQAYYWGEYYIKTGLNVIPQVGQLKNRADVPREILNLGAEANPLVPDVLYRMVDTRDQRAYEFWLVGVDLERSLENVLIQGNIALPPANTEYGWISEFNGLDLQIVTGHVDAATQTACPALDSMIITFGADVGATIPAGDGRNIVQAVHDITWAGRLRASRMNMQGVECVWLMRPEAFRSIVERYACSYATYRCTSTNAGQPYPTDTSDANQLRLEMMSGQYLLVDGVAVPVVLSEGIPQTHLGSWHFESDIYFVPVSWQGQKLLRLKHFPMDNEYARGKTNFISERVAYMNNGMYVVGERDTGLCFEYHFGAKMRLILETPWLAGRIDNVQYQFVAPIRNADPNDTFFYADGGATYRS